MKNFIFQLVICTGILIFPIELVFAQNIGINNDGSAPDSSAMLDVKSNTKGFLPPRMSIAERDAINNPAPGLFILNTDENVFQGFNGTIWYNLEISSCKPAKPDNIYGLSYPECNETGLIYSIAEVPGSKNYHWTVPADATIVNGQGTTEIILDFGTQGGNVSVCAQNGCGASEFTHLVVTNGIPPQPGTISGITSIICNQAAVAYAIDTVPGARNYHWAIPVDAVLVSGQGTTEIVVDYGVEDGNISVRTENSCGNSDYSDVGVTIVIPPQPGSIAGPTNPDCMATGIDYSITPVQGAVGYKWQVPSDATIASGQGTTQITVDFGNQSGNVSVRSENTCRQSEYTDLPVIIDLPSQPGDISGPVSICYFKTKTYTIEPVPEATSYHWKVPTGATIESGQGTTSITVKYGDQSGNISVRAENSCIATEYTDLAVTLKVCIGVHWGGGIVFYVDHTGEHGLICAETDQSAGAPWGCMGTDIPGADSRALGAGEQNTAEIIAACSESGIAARICHDLVIGIYDDWFLPSYYEITLAHDNLLGYDAFKSVTGGNRVVYHWSSTEYNLYTAEGYGYSGPKNVHHPVRAIRKF
nr:hypothetical protein [Bacteroidota bacterium]